MKLEHVSRRDFLKISGAATAGLVLAVHFPSGGAAESTSFIPNAWLSLDSTGKVTVVVAKSEMGQGVYTALPAIIAEELDVDLRSVLVEQALADRGKYGDQTTGGSTSVREGWLPLRKAGAAAREMLIAAAAKQWNVDPSQCATDRGEVTHKASGKKASYASLVDAAARLPVPQDPTLKDPSAFRILGTRFSRMDTPLKTNGSAVYGMDVRVPGMLYACVARCPVPGGTAASHSEEKAMAIPGVKRVLRIDSGIAVVADSTYSAMQGCEALQVVWNEGPGADLSSESIMETYRERLSGKATVAENVGDVDLQSRMAAKTVEAEYELPYLAHAAMEPLNCTAHVRDSACEIWASTQVPNDVQEGVAKRLGIPVPSVKVHVTFLGGGFGRRLQNDDALEAAEISKAVQAPVKVVWTREQDMQHDYYRPNSLHRLTAGLDSQGNPLFLTNRFVIPSISEYLWPGSVKNGVDGGIKEELEMDYVFPHMRLDYVLTNDVAPKFPLGWWRSVYSSQNGFALECFIDELAAAAGADPLAFRLKLLSGAPRAATVLKVAAGKAGWGSALPAGRGRGLAVYRSFGSTAAMAVEASVDKNGVPVVHRAICVIDCGRVVNPAFIEAQLQSAVVFGMSSLLFGEITLNKGRVQEANFDSYEVLRISRMPKVETYVIPSTENPGGVGEPGVPVVAPAVANALFAATGKRFRKLPIRKV